MGMNCYGQYDTDRDVFEDIKLIIEILLKMETSEELFEEDLKEFEDKLVSLVKTYLAPRLHTYATDEEVENHEIVYFIKELFEVFTEKSNIK
jgi:hypothetical protein